MRLLFAIGLILLGSPALFAGDAVYRWVDKDGVVHYGAQPPSKDAKPAALPEIQTYSSRVGNKVLPLSPLDAAVKPTAGVAIKEMRVLSPVQDEIFRDLQAGVNVAVAVLPALPAGAGLVFYLDGVAKNSRPSPATSMQINGVDRGEHTITAAAVDASGRELMRAPPVTFHSKPPTAR